MDKQVHNTEETCSGLGSDLTEIEQNIFQLIKEHIIITPYEMAKKLKMPISEIEDNLGQMAEKGIMIHVGNRRTGYWKIVKK